MATGQQVASFLQQVSVRNVTDRLPENDLGALQQLGLLQRLTAEELQGVQQEVSRLEQARLELAQEASERAQAGAHVATDTRTTHSILFHLRGVDSQHAFLEHLQQEQQAVQSLDANLLKRQQDFAQLLVKKSLLDAVSPYDGGYIAITTAGRTVLRDLNVRLYRVGDREFSAYWEESKRVDAELGTIAFQSAQMAVPLANSLTDVEERSYLWAVAIGMAKAGGDPQAHLTTFVDAYHSVSTLSKNLEDRLMSAEILSVLPAPVPESTSLLAGLTRSVHGVGVPDDVALGVGSILLVGRRADGTFALDPLRGFLTKTASYEAAALMAIVNRPPAELLAKFDYLRSQFAGWGYSTSEDTELSSAYLASSELPANTVAPKIAILARGLGGYLQYPLVASSILASIPVLEANETLNLLEKAYEILGQRTGPMSQAELITLAVRMVHGIQVESVDELDPTARAAAAPRFSYAGAPPRVWLPVFITHHVYYATFSGIGGAHPGHVHAWGGGGWGGGGFVG